MYTRNPESTKHHVTGRVVPREEPQPTFVSCPLPNLARASCELACVGRPTTVHTRRRKAGRRMSAAECDPRLEALPTLIDLPLDCQLKLLGLLDGPSLARYAECTSRRLASLVSADLKPLWAALYESEIQSAPVVPSAPQPDEPLAFVRPRDDAVSLADPIVEIKSAFVRGLSALQHRCPRCGRQHAHGRHGAPLDDHGRFQRHLCDWFVAAPRDRAQPVAIL